MGASTDHAHTHTPPPRSRRPRATRSSARPSLRPASRGVAVALALTFAPAVAACTATGPGESPDGGAGPGGDAGPGDPGPHAPEIYTADRTHSPITPFVAARLREIAARAPDARSDVFAKIGDAATVSTSFLHCFDDGYTDPAPGDQAGDIDLDGRDALKPTIALFRAGVAGGINPFERTSRAASVEWTAADPLAGSPSPLARELAEIAPRYAVVMLGTEDLPANSPDAFGTALWTLADALVAAGVVPILTTIPPRDDDPALGARVPRHNAVIRAVAQAAQVPLVDYHRALVDLPGHGLGPDGVRPSVYRDPTDPAGGARPCALHAGGLQHGHNARNLVTVEALRRVTDVLARGADPPDAAALTGAGAGSPDDPFEIPALPFVAAGDTALSDNRTVDVYSGCAAAQDESGPELIYRLDLPQAATIRAMVIDRGATDVDVHVLAGSPDGDACVARAHRELAVALDAGTYYVALDTFVSGGQELSGEFLLAVVQE